MRFLKEILEVHQEACKNYGNKNPVCKSCVDSCVQQAISLVEMTPIIDHTKCIDCGACISECSVLAIDHVKKPYKKIQQQIQDHSHVEITCEEVVQFPRGIKIPCLLYLDVVLLSNYATNDASFSIFIGQCDSCEKFETKKILNHLKILQMQLDQLRIPLQLKTKEMITENDGNQTIDAISRRDIFKSFSINKLREFLFPSRSLANDGESALSFSSTKERMKFKKEMLNNNLNEVEIKEIELLNNNYFLSIWITDDCTGCSVCENICPTAAIQWETLEDKSELVFKADQCIACFKCKACPEEALKIKKTKEMLRLQNITLITMQNHTCHECKQPFRAKEEHDHLCFICSSKSTKDPLRFFVG